MSITKRMTKYLNESYKYDNVDYDNFHNDQDYRLALIDEIEYMRTGPEGPSESTIEELLLANGASEDYDEDPDEGFYHSMSTEQLEKVYNECKNLSESYKRRGRKINESFFDKNDIYQDYFCRAFINEYTSEVAMSFRYVLDDAEKGKIFIEEYPEIINDLKAYGLSFSGDKEIACLYKVAKRFGLVI